MPDRQDGNEARQDQQRRVILVMLLGLLGFLLSTVSKEPYHTSALSGEKWILELLQGHPVRIHYELRIHKDVFLELIVELVGRV
jgi:hypothetical protein